MLQIWEGRIPDKRPSCESALEGSRREYRLRRQTARSAHDSQAESVTSERAVEACKGLGLETVRSGRLLCGVRRAEWDGLGQIQRSNHGYQRHDDGR